MNFSGLEGFGYLDDSNKTYYVMDYFANRIIIFDSNWQYLTFQSLDAPSYMITVNNNLYISSDNNVFKTDKYLNIISQYNSVAAGYLGLYYNSSSNTIYVAGYNKYAIDVFDLNLNLVDSISTSNYYPVSIHGYKNYIYVGTGTGELIVIENKVINQTFSVCTVTLLSIQIDDYGYMAFSCDQTAYLYYSANLSYTGMNTTYDVQPKFINFDSNGRFIVVSDYQIDIYNY